MASIHRRLRPYRQAGLYRGRASGTPPAPTPTQQRSIATLRDELVADHLQNDPTAGQSVILDLLTFAKVRHADATNYLATMPRPWVDRRSHRAWQIVHDLGRLERHIAKLTQALVDPVLERRPQPVETLADYVAKKDAEATNGPPAGDPAPVPQAPAAETSKPSNWSEGSAESAERVVDASVPEGETPA
jgi:hypothetical protein